MESPRQKQNVVFMVVLAIMIIGATLLHKPPALKFTDKLQNMNSQSVYEEIAKAVGAGSSDEIYIKRLDVLKDNKVIRNTGEPAFVLTIYPDGSIYRIIFNIAYKGTETQYTTYQAVGGSTEKKTNGGLVLSKSGKIDDIGSNSIVLKDILFSLKNISLKDIEEISGKSTLYQLKISRIYVNKDKLDISDSKTYYLIDKSGKLNKLKADELTTADRPLAMMPVSLSDNNGHTSDSNVILLVEINR